MPEFEAILFDFDGVLVDSEPLHYANWREALAPFGLDLDWDVYHTRCRGLAGDLMLEALADLSQPRLRIEDLRQALEYKKTGFRTRSREVDLVTDEIRRFLPTLQPYRLAVVSSAHRVQVEPMLQRGGIRQHFHALVCGDEVKEVKPDPEPYRRAAELLGVEHALVVEDSEAGRLSGLAAGFEVLMIPEAAQMPALLRARLLL